MADIYLSSTTGKAVTAQLYNGATAVTAALTMTEIGTTGEFYCNVPAGTPAGKYLVIFMAGSDKLASGQLEWDGTKEALISDAQDRLLDAQIEPGVSLKGSIRLHNAFMAGQVRGAGSNVEKFSNLAGTHDVIVSTNDANGNRRSVQLHLGD